MYEGQWSFTNAVNFRQMEIVVAGSSPRYIILTKVASYEIETDSAGTMQNPADEGTLVKKFLALSKNVLGTPRIRILRGMASPWASGRAIRWWWIR